MTNFCYNWYSLILIFNAALSLLLAFFAWRRKVRGSKTLALLMLAIAEWSLSGALEAAAIQEATKVFWSQVSYVGIHSLPVFYLILAWQYNQRDQLLTKKIIIPLWIIPVITMALVATNAKHHLIWSDFHWDPTYSWILIYEYGPAFWTGTLYVYALVLIATINFFYITKQSTDLYKWQSRLIILGAIIPLLGNALYIAKIDPLTSLDLSPVYFLFTGLLLSLSMYRFKFLDLLPVAHIKVLNTMTDAVIVIDHQLRIGDINVAAQNLVGHSASEAIGQPSSQILERWPFLSARFREKTKSPTDLRLIPDKNGRWFETRISPLREKNDQIRGWLIILRDITEQRKLESALREREELYRNVTENANDGIAIVQDNIIKYSNPQLAIMLGLSIEEFVNQPFVKFIAPEYVEAVQRRYERRMRGDPTPSNYETALLHTSGCSIPVEFNVSSIEYENELATLAIVRDISARKINEKELQQYARQQKLLNDITRAAIETTTIEITLQILADRLGELIQSDGCYINLWDAEKQCTIYTATYGSGGEQYANIRVEPEEPTITKAVLAQKHYLIIEDVFDTSYHTPERAAQLPVRSILAIPLIISNEKLGAALIAFQEQHTFTREEIMLGEQAGRQVALTLFKNLLVERARKRAKEMETLRDAGLVVASTLKVNEAIENILEQLQRVVTYDSACVQLLNEDFLEIVGGRGWPDPDIVIGIKFPIPGDNPNSIVVESRQPYIISDTSQTYPFFEHSVHNYIRSWLGVPLIVHDQVIGMLAVDSLKVGYFTQEHARLVSAFANQVAVAIVNARLFEETQNKAKELSFLYNVVTTAMTSVHLDETLESTMQALQDTLEADNIAILLIETETNKLVICAHLGFPDGPKLMRRDIGVGIPGWVVETEQPVLLSDVRGDERYYGCDSDVLSELCVPLRVGDKVIGAINLESRRLAAFNEEDLHLLTILASHLAIIIENARLFEQVQHLATMDELTGINNRRNLFELGRRELERARRYGHPLSVIMLDIDHFKQVNDTYGHAVGDEVLYVLAQRCQDNIREIDHIGRYGGEEFSIILPETTLDEALTFAERIRAYIQNTLVPTTHGDLSITISLGVAELPSDITNLAALLDLADTALYAAKQAGRNSVRSFSEL